MFFNFCRFSEHQPYHGPRCTSYRQAASPRRPILQCWKRSKVSWRRHPTRLVSKSILQQNRTNLIIKHILIKILLTSGSADESPIFGRIPRRTYSHQYENDNDSEYVISLGVLWVHSNHDVNSHHFVQTSSRRSNRTRFCWFASICGHFPLANAMPFDYLKNNWWRVRYRYRIRTAAKRL
jgi:hypothetical protein